MKDIQDTLIAIVKEKTKHMDNIGQVLADTLSISIDAAYRRSRGKTLLTIDEVSKLCSTFNISFDRLNNSGEETVTFEYSSTKNYDFSLEGYLADLLDAFKKLEETTQPKIILTANNLSVFQLLNFPHLVRFRLYFWAKTHLQVPEYQNVLFENEKITENAYNIGWEILQRYNKIPTTECYDLNFLKGLLRHIHYYASAHYFKDPGYALRLIDEVKMMADHIKEQCSIGQKYVFRKETPPENGNEYNVYINDTVNSENTFYYHSEEAEGIYLAHNYMNYLHTNDLQYTEETKAILQKQLANSSLISKVNQKQRNTFFHKIDATIDQFRKKVEAEFLI
jgi:hypothetical protein